MAIEKLNLLTVTGPVSSFEAAFAAAAGDTDFEFEEPADTGTSSPAQNETEAARSRTSALLSRLDALAERFGLSFRAPETPPPKTPLSDRSEEELTEKVTALERELDRLTEADGSLSAEIEKKSELYTCLSHFGQSDVQLDELRNFTYFKRRFGSMPRESYDSLHLYAAASEDFLFLPTSLDRTEVWGLYFTPRARVERTDAFFRSLHFERVPMPEGLSGTPAEAVRALDGELSELRRQKAENEGAREKFLADRRAALTDLLTEVDRRDRDLSLRRFTVVRGDTFLFSGWYPARRRSRLTARLGEIASVSVTAEPAGGQKEPPPTRLRNLAVFRPFEQFVRMYGLPAYNELDPTPFVALSYFLFFGMMFGDIGQGAVLVLVGLLFHFALHLPLGKIISCVGVSSMLFGAVYGSIFGLEGYGLNFNPTENMTTILQLAIYVGVVTLLLVMILNIANGVRQKSLRKMLLSPNGLVGLLLYAAAIIPALALFGLIENFLPAYLTGVIVAVIVVCVLLLFFAEPLLSLLQRRGKREKESGSVLDFVLESFFELFEVVLSYMTNTISFIRIGAFALSHVGMMTVVKLLAHMDTGSPNYVIFVIGNLFVVGFEGLIVGIQVLRLEFYELFGRFFEGTGRAPRESEKRVLGVKS